MNRNKYGGNSIGKDKPEMEESFGNNVYGVGEALPLPKALKPWYKAIQAHQKAVATEGQKDEWRPNGSDPRAYPLHHNKKDKP